MPPRYSGYRAYTGGRGDEFPADERDPAAVPAAGPDLLYAAELRGYGQGRQKRIDAKLLEAAYGEEAYAEALRDWCCGRSTVQAAAIAHGVSESTLYRARKRLYEAW